MSISIIVDIFSVLFKFFHFTDVLRWFRDLQWFYIYGIQVVSPDCPNLKSHSLNWLSFLKVFYADKSVVVCAPTGSGKTVVFELAIIRLLLKNNGARPQDKIIYSKESFLYIFLR